MTRRLLGLALAVLSIGLAVLALTGTTAGLEPDRSTTTVVLNGSAIDLVAARTTPSPSPCNNGSGVGQGHCTTPTPSPTPCSGNGCQNLLSASTNGPIVTAAGMKPGDVRAGTITITANANVYVSLFEQNVVNTPPTGDLAHVLSLVIADSSAPTSPLYTGPLDSMPSSIAICSGKPPFHGTCGRWAMNESHIYTFTVTFPGAAAPRLPTARPTALSTDDAEEGRGASVDFVWGATR